jgi:triosephosphate isomerase (TIM)
LGERTRLLVANWKMHKTVHEAVAYVREFATRARPIEGVELVVAPPFTAIAAAAEVARNSTIGLAAQNVAVAREGAYTGEVSAWMVKDAGADYAIVGHSERRQLFGETDDVVCEKAQAARGAGLIPIVCIGETLGEREGGRTLDVLDRQITVGLRGFSADDVAALSIAYEPVWAIGTGKNATPSEADEAHRHIRARLGEWFGAKASDGCRIIYGGSVKPDNAGALLALPDVDGALVGGASLDVHTFFDIVSRRARSGR